MRHVVVWRKEKDPVQMKWGHGGRKATKSLHLMASVYTTAAPFSYRCQLLPGCVVFWAWRVVVTQYYCVGLTNREAGGQYWRADGKKAYSKLVRRYRGIVSRRELGCALTWDGNKYANFPAAYDVPISCHSVAGSLTSVKAVHSHPTECSDL